MRSTLADTSSSASRVPLVLKDAAWAAHHRPQTRCLLSSVHAVGLGLGPVMQKPEHLEAWRPQVDIFRCAVSSRILGPSIDTVLLACLRVPQAQFSISFGQKGGYLTAVNS